MLLLSRSANFAAPGFKVYPETEIVVYSMDIRTEIVEHFCRPGPIERRVLCRLKFVFSVLYVQSLPRHAAQSSLAQPKRSFARGSARARALSVPKISSCRRARARGPRRRAELSLVPQTVQQWFLCGFELSDWESICFLVSIFFDERNRRTKAKCSHLDLSISTNKHFFSGLDPHRLLGEHEVFDLMNGRDLKVLSGSNHWPSLNPTEDVSCWYIFCCSTQSALDFVLYRSLSVTWS